MTVGKSLPTGRWAVAFALFALAALQPACVVAGYRSGGGWFFWPGGLGLIVMVVLAFLFLRGRRR